MRLSWVAGSVRARLLVQERALGPERTVGLAASPSLDDALGTLSGTAYGRLVHRGLELEEAQRAVFATALWHLRLLAGWLPPRGAELIRSLAAWYELANIEDRLAYLAGGPARAPYQLGSLATVWRRAEHARSPMELRKVLATSLWGDPGNETPRAFHLALRTAWARRVLNDVPEAVVWVAGAAALMVAKGLFIGPHRMGRQEAGHFLGLALEEEIWSIEELAELMPAEASWALADVETSEQLWEAEARWWRRVEGDAAGMLSHGRADRAVVVGAAASLAVDAWRTAAALDVAARGGRPTLVKEFEAIA